MELANGEILDVENFFKEMSALCRATSPNDELLVSIEQMNKPPSNNALRKEQICQQKVLQALDLLREVVQIERDVKVSTYYDKHLALLVGYATDLLFDHRGDSISQILGVSIESIRDGFNDMAQDLDDHLFELDKARQGAAIKTADGRLARIVCYDANVPDYPLLVLVGSSTNGQETPAFYNALGEHHMGTKVSHLVMA